MAQETGGAHLGERRLTSLHAIGQSLAIGPIFSAGLLTGLVASVAGFNSPLSVALGAIGALCLAYVVSLFARRFAGAGAIYEYLVHGAHPRVGVFCAGLYVTGVLCLMGVFIGVGFQAQSFFDAHLSINVAWWIWGLAGLLIATGLNYFGVRIAIRGVLALAAISAIPFLILAITIIAKGGADGNTLSAFGTGQSSLNSVFKGILFAVTLFIGFEASASIAEECENPYRSIPIALIGSVTMAGLFYIVVTYAGAIGFGVKGSATLWPALPSPMGTLAQEYVGKGLATLIDLVVLLDTISVAIAFVVAGSRVMFALSRDGLLPAPIARTSRHDTPLGGTVVLGIAGVAGLVFAGVTHYGNAIKLPNNIEAFSIATAAGSFLIEAVYAVLAVVALRLIWEAGTAARWWRIPVAIVGLATPVLAYKGSLDPWPTYPSNRGILFALVWAAIVVVWFAFVCLRRPDRVAAAATHAADHHGVPPLDETLDFTPLPESQSFG
jgi:amino acid transporter